jgi:hypothetical protein
MVNLYSELHFPDLKTMYSSHPANRLDSWWPAALVGLATLLNSLVESVQTLLS